MHLIQDDLGSTQRLLERSLIAWGLTSMAVGAVLVAEGHRRRSPSWVAAGQQHVVWGAVDTGIAAWGKWRSARPSAAVQPDVSALELVAERSAPLRKFLQVNAALDVAYVCAGLALVTAPERALRQWPDRVDTGRAVGTAVLLQGAFLLVLDVTAARRLTPK